MVILCKDCLFEAVSNCNCDKSFYCKKHYLQHLKTTGNHEEQKIYHEVNKNSQEALFDFLKKTKRLVSK